MDRFDMYRTLAIVCLNKLSKDDKVDALLETIKELHGDCGD